MTDSSVFTRETQFLLYDWMATESLLSRTPYCKLSRSDIDAAVIEGDFNRPLPLAAEASKLMFSVFLGKPVEAIAVGRAADHQSSLITQIHKSLSRSTDAYINYLRTLHLLSNNRTSDQRVTQFSERGDVRHSLLRLKTCSEGSLAVSFLAVSLLEDSLTRETEGERQRCQALLSYLSPVVAFSSFSHHLECERLSHSINSSLGIENSSYTLAECAGSKRTQPTHATNLLPLALDVLPEDFWKVDRYAYSIFKQAVRITLQCCRLFPALKEWESALEGALHLHDDITEKLSRNTAHASDNCPLFLDFFCGVVQAWCWLAIAHIAAKSLEDHKGAVAELSFYRGKIQAARHYLEQELPGVMLKGQLLMDNNVACASMKWEWF